MRRLPRTLVNGTVLVALATVTGCGSDSDSAKAAGDVAGSSGSAGQADEKDQAGGGLPAAGTMRGAQEFLLGAGLPCTSVSTDRNAKGAPAQGFLGTTSATATDEEKRKAASWRIKEAGVCGEHHGSSWVIYLPEDMETFQRKYRDAALETAKESDGSYGSLRTGRYLFGADFVVDPTSSLRDSGLLETGLLILNCDPDLKVASGYRKQDALVDGCALTNYIPG
ncbi:hypothetical protein ABZ729_14965 [Streptomyces sp. NPDC006678]|uniref:hypothetical protein n=1 Tax=unclassified Streptomyces TaxID=2593676 RepID=UPI0033ED720F